MDGRGTMPTRCAKIELELDLRRVSRPTFRALPSRPGNRDLTGGAGLSLGGFGWRIVQCPPDPTRLSTTSALAQRARLKRRVEIPGLIWTPSAFLVAAKTAVSKTASADRTRRPPYCRRRKVSACSRSPRFPERRGLGRHASRLERHHPSQTALHVLHAVGFCENL